jgi:hypothetical protein
VRHQPLGGVERRLNQPRGGQAKRAAVCGGRPAYASRRRHAGEATALDAGPAGHVRAAAPALRWLVMDKRPITKPPEHRTYPRGGPAPPRPEAAARGSRWQRAVPPDRRFPRVPARTT